jgi:RimJ/RimL family protein N-acetyltransferase
VALVELLNDADVSRMTSRMPYPYGIREAQAYITRHEALPELSLLVFAKRPALHLVGGVGLHNVEGRLELGYWVGKRYWGCGYATEAARGLLHLAYSGLGIAELRAAHASDNPASGRVLRKLGFRPTGQEFARYSAARQAEMRNVDYACDLMPVLSENALACLAA